MENPEKETRKIIQYSKEALEKALEEVKSQRLSIWESAKQNKIPYITLKRKIENLNHHKNIGKPTILSEVEEKELAKHIEECASKGFPLNKNRLLDLATQIANTHQDPKRRFGENGKNKSLIACDIVLIAHC